MKLFRFRLIFRLVLLSLVFKESNSKAEFKQWRPNTNWHNPNNWAKGKIPCPLQDVNLLSLHPLVVAVSGHTPLHSLSLPMNGELILNKDAELTFFEKNKPREQCSATGDVHFIANAPKNWYNPTNWRVVGDDGNPVLYQSNGLLHLNQIPCLNDQVQFQKGNSFLLRSDQDVTIASMLIDGQVYTQSSFQEYLGSDMGRIQFNLNTASITLTGQPCNDPNGCFCNTSQARETVCSFVKCQEPQCKTPLTPSGSCCSFCGAIMKVKPSSTFILNEFKDQIFRLSGQTLQRRSSQVQLSISRTEDGLIQVVFTDFEDGKKAQVLAQQIADHFSGSSQLVIKERIQSGSVSRSGRSKQEPSSLGLSVGLGVGLGVLLLIVIIVVLLLKRKRRTLDNNSNLQGEDNDQLELQQRSESSEELQDQRNKDQIKYQNLECDNSLYETSPPKITFDNPLYDSTSHLEREI